MSFLHSWPIYYSSDSGIQGDVGIYYTCLACLACETIYTYSSKKSLTQIHPK